VKRLVLGCQLFLPVWKYAIQSNFSDGRRDATGANVMKY